MPNTNRKSTFFNHLSAVSEGIPAFGWILVAPTPGPHIKEMIDAAQFYTNRVLKDFKDKDPIHAEWVKLWIRTLTELHAYVKQHHTTGLNWGVQVQRDSNRNGSASSSSVAPTVSLSKVVPVEKMNNLQINNGPQKTGLMTSINLLGANATSHLKKVPDEIKTHKNPQIRESADGKSAKVGVNRNELSHLAVHAKICFNVTAAQ